MSIVRYAIIGGIAALAAVSVGRADDLGQMVLIPNAAAVKWGDAPPSLPKGVQLSVLSGDPSKPGPFVLRVIAPPNAIVKPHTHPTAENLTVISGTVFHGMGDKVDRSAGQRLESGGFVFLPANMPHSVWTTDEPAVLQVTGTGPFAVQYVNAADDPSNAK